jgi:MFS family permease
MLAFTSVVVAPWLQRRLGTLPSILGSLLLFAADLAVLAVFTEDRTVLVLGIIVAGAFLGVNNTLITEAVMGAAPVERPVASAAYSFLRFSGAAVAPYAAGRLGEDVSVHAPFWMGAAAVVVGAAVLVAGRRTLGTDHDVPQDRARRDEAELLAVADLD